MSKVRIPKIIKDKSVIDRIANMTEEDGLKESFFMETFGDFDGQETIRTYDIITIPPGSYGPENNKNINQFQTTVGRYWFNKVFIEKDFFELFGYVNETVTDKYLGSLEQEISYAVLEDRVPLDSLKRFIMKCQKLQPASTMLCPSYTDTMFYAIKKIEKRKEELMKKYKKAIDSGDAKAINDMETELINYAKELLKDDPSADMFNSGARGSWGNNFKNLFIMKGAVADPDPDKGYHIITSNYINGIKKEEYVDMGKSLVEGPYKRAKKTEVGGYWEKCFLNAFQHIILGPKDSDCGTKRYLEVTLTKKNIKNHMYNYILDNGKLVELTHTNSDKYIGKKVKMRFSSLCQSKDYICNKCSGNLFYRLGIKNIGTATPQIPSVLKNISMKSFHNSVVDFAEMDPMKAFGLE